MEDITLSYDKNFPFSFNLVDFMAGEHLVIKLSATTKLILFIGRMKDSDCLVRQK